MSQVIEVVERYLIPDLPDVELPSEDGIPLQSNWHRIQINLLVDILRQHWRGRTDFFAGGNMFLYYSVKQARSKEYKGPDFFVVRDVDGTRDRRAWVAWEEDGRLPDVIVELLSPTTAAEDLGAKKSLYERTFKTPEYFCYDPDTRALSGWRLERRYMPLETNAGGRMWSEQLQVWLGRWEGEYQGVEAVWLRFYRPDGALIPTGEEFERQRAEAAEAEVARLRAELAKRPGG